MRILADQPRDAAQAEARAEAVDQVREVGLMVGRRESGLLRIAALGDERRKPHHVVAEAGIDLVADHVEPVGEQPRDARGIAQRLAGAGLDAKHFAVGAEQRDLQQPRAFATLLSSAQSRAPSFSIVPSTSRSSAIGSAKRCSTERGGHRQARRDRLVLAPERLIDAADERRAEPRRERRARAVEHIGDVLEADLREGFDYFGRKPQRREGEGGDDVSFIAGR